MLIALAFDVVADKTLLQRLTSPEMVKAPSNYKDEAKIEAYVEKVWENIFDQAATHPFAGRITNVGIAISYFSDKDQSQNTRSSVVTPKEAVVVLNKTLATVEDTLTVVSLDVTTRMRQLVLQANPNGEALDASFWCPGVRGNSNKVVAVNPHFELAAASKIDIDTFLGQLIEGYQGPFERIDIKDRAGVVLTLAQRLGL